MTDVLGEGLRAVATRSALAYPLVFAAGVMTSVGPCVAPRYIAVAALVSASRTPWRIAGAYVAGLVGACVTLGVAAGALGMAWSASGFIYAALAIVLGAGGLVTLLRGGDGTHEQCGGGARMQASLGGTFLLGASSAFVVSPCCTPMLAGIAGVTTMSGRLAEGAALLASFACGHAMPVIAAAVLGSRIGRAVRRIAISQAPSVVAGSLMLALAAYYGALA